MASYEKDLFWKTTHGPKLKGKEAAAAEAAYNSADQTGQRLVVLVRGWLTHALEKLPEKLPGQLPEDCRAWFRVNLDRPGFSDPETPHLALGELQYFTKDMPYAVPDGWELDRGQRLAVEMLMGTRDTISATYGTEMDQAGKVLVLLENALRLGSTADRAHVDPWQPVAARGLKDQADKRRAARHRHEEEQSDKEFVLEHYWRRRDEFKSMRQAAKQIHDARLVLIRDWRTIYDWIRQDERERKRESVQSAR